jgi:SWI/SNF-related matrix-associated actin-dependent regulator 1 of chromatin subfamily A
VALVTGAEVGIGRATALALSRAVAADYVAPAPAGLACLPFQNAGVLSLLARPAALLADEMGLGKTVQAIALLNADESLRRAIVVCPATLRLNWKRELNRWLTRPLSVALATSTEWPAADIVIVNYDILHKHAAKLATEQFDLAIVDEAHYAKNPKARRTVMTYSIKARRRVLMTGTPIVNRPKELFPLLNYLDPITYPKFFPYAMRYCNATRGRFGWDFDGASHLDELQEKLRATVMIRRLKANVLTELPAKRRQVIEIPANGCGDYVRRERDAEARHEGAARTLRAAVDAAREAGDENAYREAVYALRTAELAAFEEMARLRHDTAVAKVPYVVEHLRDVLEAGEKVVVFAHHHDVVDAIASEFGSAAVVVDGRTPMAQRQVNVDRFQNDDAVAMFVGGITAAGVGITLTAASHVVFAELDWVPGNMTQAEDRCHRIGQRDSVLVQHLVLEGSIDARMAHTLVAKQATMDAALDVVAEGYEASRFTLDAREEQPVIAPRVSDDDEAEEDVAVAVEAVDPWLPPVGF